MNKLERKRKLEAAQGKRHGIPAQSGPKAEASYNQGHRGYENTVRTASYRRLPDLSACEGQNFLRPTAPGARGDGRNFLFRHVSERSDSFRRRTGCARRIRNLQWKSKTFDNVGGRKIN